jgi:hypothetical protein
MSVGTMTMLKAHEGDVKYEWDSDNPVEVAAARLHFAMMKAQGFSAYKAEGEGAAEHDREMIRELEGDEERVVFFMGHVGG